MTIRHALKKGVPLADLLDALDLRVKGNLDDARIEAVASLDGAAPGVLCFSKAPVEDRPADGTIIIAPEGEDIIVSENPRLDFIRALAFLMETTGFDKPDRPPIIAPSARIASSAHIANDVTIGENVIVEHGVVIHSGVVIGDDCHIGANTVIGCDGFGYERLDDGTPVKFIHLGGVLIGNNVDIGPLTVICRGTLADTVVGDHAKIDSQVHVAHNCQIGEGAFVVAMTELNGGVKIGRNAWVGPNSSIINRVKIAPDSKVGLAAVVLQDTREGETVFGNPARVVGREKGKTGGDLR